MMYDFLNNFGWIRRTGGDENFRVPQWTREIWKWQVEGKFFVWRNRHQYRFWRGTVWSCRHHYIDIYASPSGAELFSTPVHDCFRFYIEKNGIRLFADNWRLLSLRFRYFYTIIFVLNFLFFVDWGQEKVIWDFDSWFIWLHFNIFALSCFIIWKLFLTVPFYFSPYCI